MRIDHLELHSHAMSSVRDMAIDYGLGWMRVPFPSDFVRGIDTQKGDFERGEPCFVWGGWKPRGVWYFYLMTLILKSPIGIVGVVLLRLITAFRNEGCRHDEVSIVTPGVAVIVLASAMSGITEHLRYVLPSLPFFAMWASKLVYRRVGVVVVLSKAMLCCAVSESIMAYPHSMAFRNPLCKCIPMQLLSVSNIDGGQDMLLISQWIRRTLSSDDRVVYVGPFVMCGVNELNGRVNELFVNGRQEAVQRSLWEIRAADWVIVSDAAILGDGSSTLLSDLSQVGRIGYTHSVFRVIK